MLSNPQMREVIERNPEVGHILNDSRLLRQTMEMMRNPELMREMMRGTDRALSNIEALPEGFNHLRRMYNDIQEPMMNASQNPFSSLLNNNNQSQSQPSTPLSPPTTPNTTPLPNPWAPRNFQTYFFSFFSSSTTFFFFCTSFTKFLSF